ncbi:MAG: hypothetical protein HYX41_02970 [Bdellovibrio sp.]|nr:hypothetical protein [Bdellovibrio sp.]
MERKSFCAPKKLRIIALIGVFWLAFTPEAHPSTKGGILKRVLNKSSPPESPPVTRKELSNPSSPDTQSPATQSGATSDADDSPTEEGAVRTLEKAKHELETQANPSPCQPQEVQKHELGCESWTKFCERKRLHLSNIYRLKMLFNQLMVPSEELSRSSSSTSRLLKTKKKLKSCYADGKSNDHWLTQHFIAYFDRNPQQIDTRTVERFLKVQQESNRSRLLSLQEAFKVGPILKKHPDTWDELGLRKDPTVNLGISEEEDKLVQDYHQEIKYEIANGHISTLALEQKPPKDLFRQYLRQYSQFSDWTILSSPFHVNNEGDLKGFARGGINDFMNFLYEQFQERDPPTLKGLFNPKDATHNAVRNVMDFLTILTTHFGNTRALDKMCTQAPADRNKEQVVARVGHSIMGIEGLVRHILKDLKKPIKEYFPGCTGQEQQKIAEEFASFIRDFSEDAHLLEESYECNQEYIP